MSIAERSAALLNWVRRKPTEVVRVDLASGKGSSPGRQRSALIHPLAWVDPAAQLADDVEIGPFCVVGPEVVLGAGCRLTNNVTILGKTTIGAGNIFFPNAVLGAPPQDKKFKGEQTRLEIGDNNHFRESVTVHLGTDKGGGLTRIGSNNLLMVNVHLGHDVFVGNNCVLSNNMMVAGHVHIGNNVVLSGGVGIHHFVTIDDYVYVAGYSQLTHDVPPFVKVDGSDRIRGLNGVGLKRNGFTEGEIETLEQAVWRLFLDRDRPPISVNMPKFLPGGEFGELGASPHVQRILQFMERRAKGKHGRHLESMRTA
ncbi:MAG: acyl-ACP--UDP-N-acetylglucosamine O-acyltransferase [Tepidisphaeraceae bacterium]